MVRLLHLFVIAALLSACPSGTERYEEAELGLQVGFICPGDPSGICDFSDETELRVGAAKYDITPTDYETWIDEDGDSGYRTAIDTFLDCGVDRLCPGDEGYSAPDEGESDGLFQALWLAGFDNARPMTAVADPIWARATVIEQGNTSIGVVSVDLVGLFYNQVIIARETVAEELGLDHVIISSTHVHEVPDTMGQWGPNIARSGVNPTFMALIHTGVLESLRQAQAEVVPADVHGGRFDIPHSMWEGTGVNNVNLDTRDPNITDETVWTTRFTRAGTDETIGTWINFANHPEAAASDNLLLTADFPHTLRLTVEEGASEGPEGALAGLGGVATYFQGACGGMMTPLRIDTIDLDGTLHTEHGIPKAHAVGRVIGYHALQSVAADAVVEAPELSVRVRDFFLRVENAGFHVMLNAGVFERPGYNYDPDQLIGEYNEPDLKTEVSLLQIGSISALTIPGELLPELAIGGYDGSHTGPVAPIVDPNNENPPDLSAAPEGPYYKDLMPGETKLLLGLGNDEVGYFVPDYNFILDEGSPYLEDAPGDHYEETNSVGALAVGEMTYHLTRLLAWEAPQAD
ncbi:MAG: hypothetical protein GY898_26090 [Proteobacteria bacterium]|nr:hypothetical protein [Pseudomonadota bacterium]